MPSTYHEEKGSVMAFNDFTLETAEVELGVRIQPGSLFGELTGVKVPAWLRDSIDRGLPFARTSEKARSEFIVAPILLALRELCDNRISILSGQRLDVDPARRLTGECDFLVSLSEPLPLVRSPILTLVEAKKNDIEAGLGQCIAQMVAANVFNERSERTVPVVYGCVTTGEAWQFLGLQGAGVTLDPMRYYLDNLGLILAALRATIPK
jgi:hypothetical protein